MGISHPFPALDEAEGEDVEEAPKVAEEDREEDEGAVPALEAPREEAHAHVHEDEGLGDRGERGEDLLGGDLGRKRVIQRRFNVAVPRARVPKKDVHGRDRSER